MALIQATKEFLPPENVQKFNKEVADFFLQKALKEKEDGKLQLFCLDKAFGFMYDEENLVNASQWIALDKVVINGETLEVELTPDQKYQILKHYYASSSFNNDQKKELKEIIFKGDDSDKGKKV